MGIDAAYWGAGLGKADGAKPRRRRARRGAAAAARPPRAREVAAERARAIFDRTSHPNGGPRHDQDPCGVTVEALPCMLLCPLARLRR